MQTGRGTAAKLRRDRETTIKLAEERVLSAARIWAHSARPVPGNDPELVSKVTAQMRAHADLFEAVRALEEVRR